MRTRTRARWSRTRWFPADVKRLGRPRGVAAGDVAERNHRPLGSGSSRSRARRRRVSPGRGCDSGSVRQSVGNDHQPPGRARRPRGTAPGSTSRLSPSRGATTTGAPGPRAPPVCGRVLATIPSTHARRRERPSKRSTPLKTATQASCTTSSATPWVADVAASDGEHRRESRSTTSSNARSSPRGAARRAQPPRREQLPLPRARPPLEANAAAPLRSSLRNDREADGDSAYMEVVRDESRERPVIRLFGPLVDRGRRAPPWTAATSAARGRSRCSRSCSRPAGHRVPATASPSCLGRRAARRTPPARCRRSSPCFAATSHRTASVRASSSSPRTRRTASRPSSWCSTSTASTSCSSARRASRRASPARSLEQALDLVRGEVLEDEPYATWALDLRGTYQGRVLGARLDAADAALAELDYAPALAHAEAAAALDRFSERAHRLADARPLRARALARGARPLPRASASRLDEELGLEPSAETRALESAIIRQEDVHSLLPRPIGRARTSTPAVTPSACSAARPSSTRFTAAVRRGLDGGLALIQIEGEAGVGKTRLLDELERELGRRAASDARAARSSSGICPTCRSRPRSATALAGVELDAARLPALGQILPELALAAPRRGVRRGRGARGARRAGRRARSARAAPRRSACGRPADTRRARLPPTPRRETSPCALVTTAAITASVTATTSSAA